MEILFLLIGVLRVSELEMMDQRLQNTWNLHMKARKNTDPHLHLRDHHSIQIFFWLYITSTFLFGKLILITTKNQFSIQLHLSTQPTILAVLSRQLDQESSSSLKPMVSMFGISWTVHSSQVWHSISLLVLLHIWDSSTISTLIKDNTWLLETKKTEHFSYGRFHPT